MSKGAVAADRVALFMQLAGHRKEVPAEEAPEELRILGAHLLLSEVLEFVIKGLGVTPCVGETPITDPEQVSYRNHGRVDPTMMLDGLADVGYTMWWNALAFGMPLAEAFKLVCENNLEKFVKLGDWAAEFKELPIELWHCQQGISWPTEVVKVVVVHVDGAYYAVGRDDRGKVRKPSSYRSVELQHLLQS
ncbi:MAG: hypothetical protein QY326_05390 [Bdellovibrionota bacterium]|nr:MAG: hypothetical protein QY326_05390 [Bdellovibrionota bacterium]